MRLKLDENIPDSACDELAAQGHDVHTVHDESLSGAADPMIGRAATAESRVLVTFDLDFADIRRYPPGTHAGVIVLRTSRTDIDSCLAALARLVFNVPETDIPGNLVVVDDDKVRIRRPTPQP
jgi:predicted nuclease of predicted toxin-antitoxin system